MLLNVSFENLTIWSKLWLLKKKKKKDIFLDNMDRAGNVEVEFCWELKCHILCFKIGWVFQFKSKYFCRQFLGFVLMWDKFIGSYLGKIILVTLSCYSWSRWHNVQYKPLLNDSASSSLPDHFSWKPYDKKAAISANGYNVKICWKNVFVIIRSLHNVY